MSDDELVPYGYSICTVCRATHVDDPNPEGPCTYEADHPWFVEKYNKMKEATSGKGNVVGPERPPDSVPGPSSNYLGP